MEGRVKGRYVKVCGFKVTLHFSIIIFHFFGALVVVLVVVVI